MHARGGGGLGSQSQGGLDGNVTSEVKVSIEQNTLELGTGKQWWMITATYHASPDPVVGMAFNKYKRHLNILKLYNSVG